MTISDFKLAQATVECRYEQGYLMFDRAGAICQGIKLRWPETRLTEGNPAKIQLQAGPQAIVLELKQSTLASAKPDPSLQVFSDDAEWLFGLVGTHLEITAYTRLGFRAVFKREAQSPDDAVALFKSTRLLRLPSGKVFGADRNSELSYTARFEAETAGATVRIATETVHLEFEPPPSAGELLKPVKQEVHSLIYDVDYFTLGMVEVAQLSMREGLKQAIHFIRRDSADFLEPL